MNSALIELLGSAREVQLLVDGVAITIGPQPASVRKVSAALTEPNRFWMNDGTCQVRFNGQELERKISLGLGYIHALLCQPHDSVSAQALWTETACKKIGTKSEIEFERQGYAELGLHAQPNCGEPLMSDESLCKVINGLQEAERDLADYEEAGDEEEAAKLRVTIAKLKDYVKRATFAGRVRRFDGPSEKARKRVSNAIARAIADLMEEHPALARHLDNSIHTGKQCRYSPETEVRWIL